MTVFRAFRVAVTRPARRWWLLLAAGLLAGVAGGHLYARHQWRAALAALEADDPQAALSRLAVPLRVWWYDPEVFRVAGRAARMVGQLPLAEARLNRALALNGGASDPIRLEFLFLRVQTGELDEVAPILIGVADGGHPEAGFIFDTLALAYLNLQRYLPAYACLSRRIELAPVARAYQWRGYVQERLGRHKTARADYQQAVDLDPALVPSRLRLAEMMLEDNQAPEAAPHLERLLAAEPGRADVRARLGMCRFQQGRSDEARRLIESALPELPVEPGVYVTLARLDLQDDRPADAERHLRAVLAQDHTDTEALYNLASALRLQGRAAEAEATLVQHAAAKKTVERVNTLLRDVVDTPAATAADFAELGELLVEAGRDKLASFWLQRAVDANPRNTHAQVLLAGCRQRAAAKP